MEEYTAPDFEIVECGEDIVCGDTGTTEPITPVTPGD